MPLPILQSHVDPTENDLLRYFARAQLHWARHLGEEAALDVGTAISNPELPTVGVANRIIDASLPDGISPEQAVAEADAHFSAAGRCLMWEMNPAAPTQRTQPLADHLLSRGFVQNTADVLYLRNYPTEPLREVGNLKIIPARASFKHARALADAIAQDASAPQLADALMLHLDDSHTDALVAIRDGVAVAYFAVLAVGEIGAVQALYVAAPFRGQGIGRTMMSRALEICARSLFKHIFIAALPTDERALAFYYRCGFQKVGASLSYRAPT